MHVAGSVNNGRGGLDSIEKLRPDVVLLDAFIPDGDGLQTLDALLPSRDFPVVMICNTSTSEIELTLAAIDRGAQGYLLKPEPGGAQDSAFAASVVRKIRDAAQFNLPRSLPLSRHLISAPLTHRKQGNLAAASVTMTSDVPAGYAAACIAVAASAETLSSLVTLIAGFRAPLPPVLVALPLAPNFTTVLARKLGRLTSLDVRQADDGDDLLPNRVLLSPGDKHFQLRRRSGKIVAQVIEFEPVSGNRPSADVLLHSAAEAYGPNLLAVILTGSGRDGIAGCAAVKACGGYVLGQDQATSQSGGNATAAFDEGYVDLQCSLYEMADRVMRHSTERLAGKSRA